VHFRGTLIASSTARPLETRAVDAVSPCMGGIRRVGHALAATSCRPAFTFMVHLAVQCRAVYPRRGGRQTLIAGYSNEVSPAIWNVAKEIAIS
jgi:hypothetical protein